MRRDEVSIPIPLEPAAFEAVMEAAPFNPPKIATSPLRKTSGELPEDKHNTRLDVANPSYFCGVDPFFRAEG